MESALRQLLEATQDWSMGRCSLAEAAAARLPELFVERSAAVPLRAAWADQPEKAHMLIGPRQVGKSTLIWALLQDASHLLYLNCEEPLIRSWCRSPGLFIAEASEWLPPGGLLFLEEAQWLEEAGLFVKGVVDANKGWHIAVTGSSSFHLEAQTRESLAGRATRHTLWPLSLTELLAHENAANPDLPAPARFARARQVLRRQLRLGGYPAAYLGENAAEELRGLREAFVIRDASDRFRIERPDAFRMVMRLAAGQVGDLVNHSEWSSHCGVAASTVKDYVHLLEETHILRLIRPFLGGKRSELISAPKVFYLDNGLRNSVHGGFAPLDDRTDLGKLCENWVFDELQKYYHRPGDVRYWRTTNGAEVDFVLEPEVGDPLGIEVKAASMARPRLSRSARSFIRAYEPSLFVVLHLGDEDFVQSVENTKVRFVPMHQLWDVIPSAE